MGVSTSLMLRKSMENVKWCACGGMAICVDVVWLLYWSAPVNVKGEQIYILNDRVLASHS